jgi:hypothetical protein
MRLVFSDQGRGIGIPYDRQERPTGINYGYFDLKRDPVSITLIPELENEPALFAFIQNINRHDSLFRSAGCACWHPATGFVADKIFIHVLFEILHWNTSINNYRLLYEDFGNWLRVQPDQPDFGEILFSVGPVSFWDHGFDGYSLRLYLEDYKANQSHTRRGCDFLLSCVSLFVDDFSRRYQLQLRGCLKRISSY